MNLIISQRHGSFVWDRFGNGDIDLMQKRYQQASDTPENPSITKVTDSTASTAIPTDTVGSIGKPVLPEIAVAV